jgi:DNA invertase Pin-like site-specific DNA recombinase
MDATRSGTERPNLSNLVQTTQSTFRFDASACELQLRELRSYCQARGWAIVKEYVDAGLSGLVRCAHSGIDSGSYLAEFLFEFDESSLSRILCQALF